MEPFTERQIEIMEAATARIDAHGIQQLTIKNLAADLGLSEPALYRHFKGKNEILLGVLDYFMGEMKGRLAGVMDRSYPDKGAELRAIFDSQLRTFTAKPAVVSVIFAESIFHFDDTLSAKVAQIMALMQETIKQNVVAGREAGHYSKLVGAGTLTTIILGSMRLAVLKWKLGGHRSDLLSDGKAVLEGILKMAETTKQNEKGRPGNTR